MKKLLQIASLSLLVSTISWALLPPKYLSVPEWKSCVGSVTKDGAKFVRLPIKKPENCPGSSWNKLTILDEMERCPCQFEKSLKPKTTEN